MLKEMCVSVSLEDEIGEENLCENCENNCCVDFRINLEVRSPEKYKRLLENYPFIKVVGRDLVRNGSKVEMMNVHRCERLDDDGNCINHDSEERPEFCHKAGVDYDPTGKGKCRLWNRLNGVKEDSTC